MKIRRNELYHHLWSEPVTEVAKKLNLTAIEIRKLCKENRIPLPANGHWMKLQFGKEVKIIPLDESIDLNEEIEFVEKSNTKQKEIKLVSSQPIENTEIYRVSEKLCNPDILIQDALRELKEREQYHHEDRLIVLFDSINIKASKKLFSRALRFMDALIKIFRKLGYEIEVKNRETHVIIGDEKVKISCREKIKRTFIKETHGQSAIDTLTGLLTFNIDGYNPKQWIDGQKRIEEQIPLILEKLEKEAERLKIWHLEIEENHKKQKAENLTEKQKEELKQKQLEDFIMLIKISERFQKAKQMREYVEVLKIKIQESKVDIEEQKKWIEWAMIKIDWYDPLINYPDLNFEDIDKDTLTIKKQSYF